MKFATACFRIPLYAAGMVLSLHGMAAADQKGDMALFSQVAGQWSGPGEIVAGKYKGTKFACTLNGMTANTRPGMSLDGTCRVGLFTEKVSATVESRNGRYVGSFLDGAKGKGLDVVGGKVTSDNRVVLALNRAKLDGAMVARMKGDNSMVVTVSVRVENKMVPVIGMSLKRIDGASVGSVASE